MQSIFDRAVDRRGSGSVKWDRADKNFGGTDLLPMWIADMEDMTQVPLQEHENEDLTGMQMG